MVKNEMTEEEANLRLAESPLTRFQTAVNTFKVQETLCQCYRYLDRIDSDWITNTCPIHREDYATDKTI